MAKIIILSLLFLSACSEKPPERGELIHLCKDGSGVFRIGYHYYLEDGFGIVATIPDDVNPQQVCE